MASGMIRWRAAAATMASTSPRRSAGVGSPGAGRWSSGSALKEASAFKEASVDDMAWGRGLRPGYAMALLGPSAPRRSMACLAGAGGGGRRRWAPRAAGARNEIQTGAQDFQIIPQDFQ